MKNAFSLPVPLWALSLLLTFAGSAESAVKSDTQTPKITPDNITLDANAEETAISLDDIVITASRYLRSTETISSFVSVIDKDEIEKGGFFTTPDILKTLPGITVRDSSTTGRNATIDIRGWGETANANSLILLDGFRLNKPDMSGPEFSIIPPNRIEKIEVVRGGAGVLYGDQAVGGVINIITHKPQKGHRVHSDSYVDTFDTFRQSLRAEGQVNNGYYYDVIGSYGDSNGYRDNSQLRSKSFNANIGYDHEQTKGIVWDLKLGFKEDQFGLPGTAGSDDHLTHATTPDDYGRSDFSYLHFIPEIRFSEDHTLTLATGWQKYHSYAQYHDYGGTETYSQIEEWMFLPKYTGTFDMMGMTHTITTGFDLRYGVLSESSNDAHKLDFGVYLNDTIQLTEKWHLDLGYRYNYMRYNYHNCDDQIYNNHAWRLGITYNYATGSKIYASVDSSFRAQRLDELSGPWGANTPLDETQETLTWQVGIEHAVTSHLLVGTALFFIDTDDEIIYDPITYQNICYGKTERYGIELYSEFRPTENFTLRGSLTCMHTEMKEGSLNGEKIPLVPNYSAHLTAIYSFTKQFTVSGNLHWSKGAPIGSDWQQTEKNWLGENYWTADIHFSWKPWTWLELYAGVRNIFDEEYATYGYYTPQNIYPEPGISAYMGLRLNWEF